MNAKMTLLGMYNFDASLFDNFTVPDGVDRKTAIDNLLLNVGEKAVLYSSVPFMKTAIGIWSRKWDYPLTKIFETLSAEYNPIHNYDRNEEFTDTEKSTNKSKLESKGTASGSASASGSSDLLSNESVSAYNSNSFTPSTKKTDVANNESSTSTKNTTSGTEDRSGSDDRELKHKAHLYGNIGVTTTQEMMLAEFKLREMNNIYEIINRLFEKELLLYLY